MSMLAGARDKVTSKTISHSFRKAGFPMPDFDSESDGEDVLPENVLSDKDQFNQLRGFFQSDSSITLESFISAEVEAPVVGI